MNISLGKLIELYNGGQHEDLESACQQLLEREPDHANGWHLAAANAIQLGKLEDALLRVNKALKLMPEDLSFINTQGSIYRQLGRTDEARDSYQRALKLDPEHFDTLYNLANLFRDSGEFGSAVELYRQLLARDARFHSARINLADLCRHMGDLQAAEREFQTLFELDGGTLQTLFGLGQVLLEQGKHEGAESCFREVVHAAPEDPGAHFYLGNVLWSQGKISEAEVCHRRTVSLMPEFHQAWNNLGNDLRDQGAQQQALECYRKAITLQPSYIQAHSNLLLQLNSLLKDGKVLLEEHLSWDEQHARALFQMHTFSNDRSPDRPLRIGYLSSDFCDHSVAYFIEGILKHHDAGRFHVSCYSNLLKPDSRTETIRSLVQSWREIGRLSDEETADLIRDDNIDILVDLSGHTARHRLMVFARKPAPIQLTYIGYPATTGMKAIDYRITDHLADPAYSDAFHRESLVRLPRCFTAFTPYAFSPEVSALPVDEAGFVRFVSFNHLSKIGPDVIQLWSRVLQAVPNSKLMVKHFSFKDEGVRSQFLDHFSECGVSSERIEIFTWANSCREHLEYYQQADIALDSFPYCGTTTTCEALWMGVPVVTLAGKLHAGRVGSTLVSSVGLQNLIAADEDEYISIVCDLVEDRERLREIRATLRERMAESELCDSAGLTTALEREYRQMWQRWLESEKK